MFFGELFQGTPYVSQLLEEVISRTGLGREVEIRDYFSKVKIEEADKGISKGFELIGYLLEPKETARRLATVCGVSSWRHS